jgi:hypothetical protein
MATYSIRIEITFQNNGVAGAAETAINNVLSSRGPRGRPERCVRTGRDVVLVLTGLNEQEALEIDAMLTSVWGAHQVTGGYASVWRDGS